MARPKKKGLDYFPLDVHMDDKIELIEAEYGLEGFAVVIKLYQKIYANGYYYKWEVKEKALFCKRNIIDPAFIDKVLDHCIEWGIFNKDLFNNQNILTSKGIQKRYMEATKRRKDEELEEYNLVDSVENVVNVYNNGVNVDINPVKEELMHTKSTQRKEKKSKVNKSKEIYTSDFEKLWQLYPRKKEKPKALKSYNARIKENVDPEQLILAVKNYSEECIRNKTEQKFIKHAATFLGSNKPYEDYITAKSGVSAKDGANKGSNDKYAGLGLEI